VPQPGRRASWLSGAGGEPARPGGDLHVLIAHGGDSRRGRQAELRQPLRVEPDAHGGSAGSPRSSRRPAAGRRFSASIRLIRPRSSTGRAASREPSGEERFATSVGAPATALRTLTPKAAHLFRQARRRHRHPVVRRSRWAMFRVRDRARKVTGSGSSGPSLGAPSTTCRACPSTAVDLLLDRKRRRCARTTSALAAVVVGRETCTGGRRRSGRELPRPAGCREPKPPRPA